MVLQGSQRRKTANEREPQQGECNGQNNEFGQDHALDDLVGELTPFFQCFCYLHQCVARTFSAWGRLGHGLEIHIQISDAHFCVAHLCIAQHH